jgi:flagellar biosynthesis/type III secretory pathway M-ring protein FliF/YscJ
LSILIAILTLALVAIVVLVVSAPLRAASRPTRQGASATPDAGSDARRNELEAAREAKYREIRDAELDYRTGKLSREDYEAIDATLRAEAIEILNRLEPGER